MLVGVVFPHVRMHGQQGCMQTDGSFPRAKLLSMHNYVYQRMAFDAACAARGTFLRSQVPGPPTCTAQRNTFRPVLLAAGSRKPRAWPYSLEPIGARRPVCLQAAQLHETPGSRAWVEAMPVRELTGVRVEYPNPNPLYPNS